MTRNDVPDDKLYRLFHPQTIAVVGGYFAERAANYCDALGFDGEIWPVHPTRSEIADRKCVSSVTELPSAPDAAFLGINRNATLEVVGALSQIGAGGAVCHAAGFREAGLEGAKLQDELVKAAGPMPIIGPNCVGILNYLDGVALWPDLHGGLRVDRGVAIITQSGNVGINITMNQRALPVAYVATLGNQAAVGISQVAAACLEDDRVSAIGLYIEGVDDVNAFDEVARRALRLKKPLVALKAGASAEARSTALHHTASITGSFELFDAFCRRVGIAHVHSLAEFVETLNLVSVIGPLKGNQIASLSASGGEASLIADSAVGRDLHFRPMAQQHRDAVQETLSELVTVSNPFDYHTFIWGDGPRMTQTYATTLQGSFDLSMLLLDWPREDRCDPKDWQTTIESWIAAVEQTDAPSALLSTFHEGLNETVSSQLHAAGIASLRGMTEGLAAVEAAWHIGRAQLAEAPAPLLEVDSSSDERDSRLLDASVAHKLLASHAIPVPGGRATPESRQAVDTPDGEVKLIASGGRDAQFGLYLTIRTGGELAEVINDRQVLLLPVARGEIEEALGRLRSNPLLQGSRGGPPGDIDALVDCLLKLGKLVEANKEQLLGIELNPLVVRPEGLGVVAADTRIGWSGEDP